VQLTGPRTEVRAVQARLEAETGAGVLTPLLTRDEEDERALLLSFARGASAPVSAALTAAAAQRSAASLPVVRHVVDPVGAL
jgi:hypothetical protein